jgi:hypothetical protein
LIVPLGFHLIATSSNSAVYANLATSPYAFEGEMLIVNRKENIPFLNIGWYK